VIGSELILRTYRQHRQFILYGIIGISGATIDFILYIIFYRFFGIPPVIASFLSVSAGIIINFIINSRHNFKVSDSLLLRFMHFYWIGVSGALLSSALIFLFYNILGIQPVLSKALTIVPVVVLQFNLNKHISFKDSDLA
jgi:putative flippase GtrA